MTDAKGGLKSRWQQFENAIAGKDRRGGAKRVRYKHKGCNSLISKLFASVGHAACNVISNKPSELRLMEMLQKQNTNVLPLLWTNSGICPKSTTRGVLPRNNLKQFCPMPITLDDLLRAPSQSFWLTLCMLPAA